MRKKKLILIILSFLFFLNIVPIAAEAHQMEKKVVRVGWYESAFHHRDEYGRRSGYGYEYQQRIATYTGWTYEYVEGSWSELFEMLTNGEIDVLSDVSYTEARAEKILYSAEPMGSEDFHVFIAPDNNEIRPDDFSTFNGKKVGVNKNSIQEQLYIEWAEKRGITSEVVELTVKTPELVKMLSDGEIDMLVTLDTYANTGDMVPVCKVGSADSYFGISKDRADLKQDMDVAMNRILEDNRDFNQQMTERYNKAGTVNSFLTSDEKAWVEERGVIRVGYRDGFLPYCSLASDGKTLTGALADFLSFAETCEKNAKLTFEPRAYATTEDAVNALRNGEIDCLFPVNLSAYDGEQLGIVITDPFVQTEMYVAVPDSEHKGVSPDIPMTVAVMKGHPNHETFLKDYFPNWQIRQYDNTEECLKAVADGEVDCTLVSNYRINRYSDLLSDYKLVTLTTGNTMDMAFATGRKDDCLYSILNKIIRLYPDTMINSSLTNYGFRDDRVTFGAFLRDNLMYFLVAVSLVTVVILLLIMKNMKSAARAEEGRQIISETEKDQLSGLYNWNFFLAYANRLFRERPERPMDSVVLNIERFHSVNALHGREFGDRVLRELGEEIRDFLTKTEGIASRVEADRFDIYCAHREDWQSCFERFQKRLDDLAHGANIRLRMGVKPWQEGMDPVQQFDCARTACNRIRNNYKKRVMIYDDAMGKQEERDQRLLNDLGNALEEHQLEVYYQPKFGIQSDPPKLSSAEALVRWKHPELGMIPPGEFISLFERSGQISALDNYVWAEAARQIADWRERFGVTLPVSVNLSRVDVFDPALQEKLDGLVKQNGLSAGELKLEVTESAYTENADQLLRVIRELREKGYLIEMDDFGSGYSSLNMLSSMPIDVLKMDIAFIRNIEQSEKDFRLVELIVDIARYLKVPVVAEGVETEKQLSLLRDAGCDLVQGYYFSRPLPAGEFEKKYFTV